MAYYSSVTAMVKTLVSYMPCDKKVKRETAVIGKPVDLQTIARIRKSHNRQKALPGPVQDNTVTKSDQDYSDAMAAASQKLALAIDRARAA